MAGLFERNGTLGCAQMLAECTADAIGGCETTGIDANLVVYQPDHTALLITRFILYFD